MGSNFYQSSTFSVNFFGGQRSGLTEADIRQEFINTEEGKYPEVIKFHSGLLRKMRRDSNNRLIRCSCINDLTKEPSKDIFCPICFGESFLFDEVNVKIYRTIEGFDPVNALRDKLTPIGLINTPLVVFYIRYDSGVSANDKIVRIALDEEGDAIIPIKRQELYRINIAWDYRLDNGRIEYWKLFTHKENARWLNTPSYEET